MDLFEEMIAAVQSDLTVDDSSTLYPPATIKSALNRSYRKIGGMHRWPETEDAKKTSAKANQEYYDFPDNWYPDSIWRLELDGKQYGEEPDGSPMSYDDYLVWRADSNNANSTEKKWAVQWRRYFIYPVPTADGSNNISVWGQKVVEAMSSNGSTTIFSYAMSEVNEAIVIEAGEILKKKGENKVINGLLSPDARDIVESAWKRVSDSQAKYEKTEPFFYVPNLFPTRGSSRLREDIIGDFN